MRRTIWIGLAALVAVILGVGLFANEIATGAVERSASHALGVETRLRVLRLSPIAGGLRLSGLRVANPPGFAEEPFLSLGSGSIEVGLPALLADPVRVRSIELEDIGLRIERQKGRSNYDTILDNLSGPGASPEPSEEAGSGAVIDRVVIRDVRATFVVAGAGRLGEYEVKVPEIRLENLGAEADPVQLSELVSILTRAVLGAVAKRSRDLPGEVVGDLNRRLARAGLPRIELPGRAQDTSDKIADQIEGAGEKAGEIVKGLGGLLGKPKD